MTCHSVHACFKFQRQETTIHTGLRITTLLIFALPTWSANAEDDGVTDENRPYLLNYPNLEDSDGRVIFENEHVVLQRLVVPGRMWEGVHSHPGNQLYVHVKGGEWTGRMAGETTYEAEISTDGEVGWMDAIPLSAGHDSGNTGDTPIDLIYVTLKSDQPLTPDNPPEAQHYPNNPLEPLFENHRMIVQRVKVEPGQFEGVHCHPGNQIFIHIKGGEWSAINAGTPTGPIITREPGDFGWMGEIDMSEGHEYGNVGDTTIDLVWITLK